MYISKKSIFILLFHGIFYSSLTTAFESYFQNFTEFHLIIASKKRAAIGSEKYYQIVAPFESVIQPWDDANCLESLQWTQVNTNLPLRGGLDLIDPNQAYQIPRDKQRLFDETFFNKTTGRGLYLWNDLPIKIVENDLFDKTIASATMLMGGFNKKTCESIDELNLKGTSKINPATTTQQCLSNLALFINATATLAGISICKSRTFLILNTGELNKLTRKPLLIAETVKGE